MSNGFKTGLFGFKKTDVINYIENLHKTHSEKEKEQLSVIDELKREISTLKDDITALNEEKERLENIQEEYIKRYSEVEKLSESIGKLYLSAQTDAKEIMDKSMQKREIIDNEVKSNLTAIEEMHSSLDSVKNDVVTSVSSFTEDLDRMLKAFEETKAKLNRDMQ